MKYKTIIYLLFIALGMVCLNSYSASISAIGKNFKYAGYRKNGNPHFILYGNQGQLTGQKVEISNVLIDLFKDSCISLENVKDNKNLSIYKINDSYNDIVKFWDKRKLTEFFIDSKQAVFDQATSTIKGDEQIKVRSKAFDIDGKGFDADYKNKTIHVRKDVQVVIRANLFKTQVNP